jgi:hypothetical protein
VCNLHIELLNKVCSGACSIMAWVVGLISLLKLIIMVCQRSKLCDYLSYGLLIQVSVIKLLAPCSSLWLVYKHYFDLVVLMRTGEILKCFVPCLGKP